MKIEKIFQKILILFSVMTLSLVSCVHDDDYADPLGRTYQDLTATIDIPTVQATAPVFVENPIDPNQIDAIPFNDGQILEGYVVSSDADGNIYKNMYIVTADGKAGVQLSINQSSLYNSYPLGSKVYIKLDGLYYGKQYGMTQIGVKPTQPRKYIVDQMPPDMVASHIILGAPPEEKDGSVEEQFVQKVSSLSALNDSYLGTLVEVSGVEFTDAGSTYVRDGVNTDNYIGSVDVRVSMYARFGGYQIPYGKGTVRGIFTKYSSTYQLLLRTVDDVKDFDGSRPMFLETFDHVTDASGNAVSSSVRPKIGVAMNFDNGAPIAYSDPTGRSDVRLLNSNACVWLPAATALDASLVIENLSTSGYTNLNLQYSFNAGIFNTGETSNANKLVVKCDGVPITVPNIPMDVNNSKNTFITVEFPIPSGTTKIEFIGAVGNNPYGMRLDNIKISGVKN